MFSPSYDGEIINTQEGFDMGIFSKLFKGPEIDMEKSAANAKKCGRCLTMWWKAAANTA